MNRVLKSTILILSAALLAACGTATPGPASTVVATRAPSLTPVSPAKTVTQTPTSAPSLMPGNSTPTLLALTSTPALPVSSVPDGLRMAYVIDGNLYLQDGSHPPLQLTDSGQDWRPTFSDDGEKITFFRGQIPHDLYVINADGTQERALVTSSLLATLGVGYDAFTRIQSRSFVPGTHRLLFNTQQLDPQNPSLNYARDQQDLLIVDTDTGDLKVLLPPGRGGNFYVSPDGSLVAVRPEGHIDIVNLDGQVVHSHLVTYTPTRPYDSAYLLWLPDSTGLIALLPTDPEFDLTSGPISYKVWRYALDGRIAAQVPFDPLPKGTYASISPDGKWIGYEYIDMSDENPVRLYIGDLVSGRAQLYDSGGGPIFWNPDSKNFIYRDLVLGVVDGLPALIEQLGSFRGWIDASYYLYYSSSIETVLVGKINEDGLPTLVGEAGIPIGNRVTGFTFIYLGSGVE